MSFPCSWPFARVQTGGVIELLLRQFYPHIIPRDFQKVMTGLAVWKQILRTQANQKAY
jgi:hypothetical protein